MAAIRIFLGAAGVPLFNDVDELEHFNLVHKFANGQWPDNRLQTMDEETAQVIVWYSCSEFLMPPEACPNGVYPPPFWTLPPSASTNAELERWAAFFRHSENARPTRRRYTMQ